MYGRWGQKVKSLFFSSGSSDFLPMGFVQALTAMDYSVVPLPDLTDMKVVGVDLQRTMDATASPSSGGVILVGRDADFLPQIEALLGQGRHAAVMCFKGLLFSQFHELRERGLKIIDLEYDVHALQVCLPRLHIIDINDFDPMSFL